MAEDRKTIKIFCRIANGVALRLTKKGYDDGTGHCPQIQDGDAVTLRGPSALHAGVNDHGAHNQSPAVENEIDAEFWTKWSEQNARNPFLMQKMIFSPEAEQRTDTDAGPGSADHI
jgi:hypothetical protein